MKRALHEGRGLKCVEMSFSFPFAELRRLEQETRGKGREGEQKFAENRQKEAHLVAQRSQKYPKKDKKRNRIRGNHFR